MCIRRCTVPRKIPAIGDHSSAPGPVGDVEVKLGINGQRAAEIRARFERDVLAVHPQYAILLAGVNDIHGGDHAEAVERHLAAMYADALDAGIVPVAATVLPYTTATTRASGDI